MTQTSGPDHRTGPVDHPDQTATKRGPFNRLVMLWHDRTADRINTADRRQTNTDRKQTHGPDRAGYREQTGHPQTGPQTRDPRLVRLVRWTTVGGMSMLVIVATVVGAAQSYAGLYAWALEHGLTGWKAQSWPLMVDTFIAVGEMGLFLLAIDGHRLRMRLLTWVDLFVPAAIASTGWIASMVFNVGHVGKDPWVQATAAVPPITAMLGLFVLLRTIHRYVAADRTGPATGPVAAVRTATGPAVVPETGLAISTRTVPALDRGPDRASLDRPTNVAPIRPKRTGPPQQAPRGTAEDESLMDRLRSTYPADRPLPGPNAVMRTAGVGKPKAYRLRDRLAAEREQSDRTADRSERDRSDDPEPAAQEA